MRNKRINELATVGYHNSGVILSILFLFGFFFVGCGEKKSQQQIYTEKATQLIREDMLALYSDTGNYKEIGATIEGKAYNKFEYNKNLYRIGIGMAIYKDLIDHLEGEIEEALQKRYELEASGASRQADKLQLSINQSFCKVYRLCDAWFELVDSVKLYSQTVDTTKEIGWKVKYVFECKNKDGIIENYTRLYILNDNFDSILYRETSGDEIDELRKTLLYDIINNKVPPLCTSYHIAYALLSGCLEKYGNSPKIAFRYAYDNPPINEGVKRIIGGYED